MRKTLLAAVAFLLMVPSFLSAATKSAEGVLEDVMVGMADGTSGSGMWVVDWLRGKNARVAFDAGLAGPSEYRAETVNGAMRPVVLINKNILGKTDGYRYYVVLIAREAANLIYLNMPDSAEKRYMVYACMGESFFEMYGTRIDLPVFSGVRDEVAGGQINVWVENDPDSGAELVSRREGVKKLNELIAAAELEAAQAQQDGVNAAQAQAKLQALRKAKLYFDNVFKPSETTWFMEHRPQ
jgi:hypothetical protein